MKIETLRVIAEWLDDATYGVNALLPNVPLDGSDTVPPDVFVLNAADDPHAALDQIPTDVDELPALIVTLYTSPVDQVVPASQPWPPDAQVDVVIRYAGRNVQSEIGVRDESYTMRAVWRSVALLMTTSAGLTARSRNSVQVVGVSAMRELTLDRPHADAVMTGAVLVTCRVRDLYAQGA